MKNLLTAFLPALALLALGGCASTAGLATSEDDGVYYSSKDRTTAVARTAPAAEPAPEAPEEATNPDYNGNTARSSNRPSARQSAGSDEYYDNTYTYMRGVPGYGPGVTYYTPYSPYTSIDYAWGMGAYGFSPYGFYDPFYSPFYSPFNGFGPGVNISIGYGRPWGFGGLGYGRQWAYGYGNGFYGNGFYDPFFHGGNFYGGYYGRGGYYGQGGYYGHNNYRGNNFGNGNRAYGNDNAPNRRTYGPRNNRASEVRYTTSGAANNPNGNVVNPRGTTTGRARTEQRMMQETPPSSPMPGETRERSEAVSAAQVEGGYNRPRRQQRAQAEYRDGAQPAEEGRNAGQSYRERLRNAETAPQPEEAGQLTAPRQNQRRRGGFFENIVTPPTNVGNQDNQTVTQQPQQAPTRRRYSNDQPRQQRTYEQPQQQQQSYEPQRASQPSYSAPSSAPSNSGGSSRGRGRSD